MKPYFLLLATALLGCNKNRSEDIRYKTRSDLRGDSDVRTVANLSESKVYTLTIRRREFRKHYRVYYRENGFGDTVITKGDTLVRYADVVVPPKTWRWIGETFRGYSTMLFSPVRMDTGVVSIFKYKTLDIRVGGDVYQMKNNPTPFDSTTRYHLFGLLGRKDEGYYYGKVIN